MYKTEFSLSQIAVAAQVGARRLKNDLNESGRLLSQNGYVNAVGEAVGFAEENWRG